jgi:hypothetical protein
VAALWLTASASTGHADPAQAGPTGTDIRYITAAGWGGYATDGRVFSTVSAEWTEPNVTCGATSDLFAPWVGIDGYTSADPHTVEQTGVETNCSSGTPVYRAWYEMAPAPPVYFGDTVKPGDQVQASVVRKGTTYTLTLTDRTQGWTATVDQTCASCENSSAEVVLESPSRHYPNFGEVTFRQATVDGKPLDSYPTSSINSVNPLDQAETQNSPLHGGAFSVRFNRE